MRDKLIGLLSKEFADFGGTVVIEGECKVKSITLNAEKFADFLIAHGVTFAADNNVPCKCGGEERFAGINKTLTMTNGDHIRAMSDEELAEFLNRVKQPCDNCQLAVVAGACTETLCDDAMENWLKQPAEVDNEHR